MRQKIIREHLIDPAFFEEMSTLLNEIIKERKSKDEELALKVHERIILYKPNGWRGIDTREKVVKKAIYDILGNVEDTERIFEIVKKQAEY